MASWYEIKTELGERLRDLLGLLSHPKIYLYRKLVPTIDYQKTMTKHYRIEEITAGNVTLTLTAELEELLQIIHGNVHLTTGSDIGARGMQFAISFDTGDDYIRYYWSDVLKDSSERYYIYPSGHEDLRVQFEHLHLSNTLKIWEEEWFSVSMSGGFAGDTIRTKIKYTSEPIPGEETDE